MICREIEKLHPLMQKQVRLFLELCTAHDCPVQVVETLRTRAVQQAYFAQGREPLYAVNTKRQAAGLRPIDSYQNRNIITKCDGVKNKSNHQSHADGYGYAVDIAPVSNGYVWWSAPQDVWEKIGLLGERAGLDWSAGGYGNIWGKGWDNPHFDYVG